MGGIPPMLFTSFHHTPAVVLKIFWFHFLKMVAQGSKKISDGWKATFFGDFVVL